METKNCCDNGKCTCEKCECTTECVCECCKDNTCC